MAKKIVAVIKLALQAGKANPAPPVGPALGQHGVNIMAFCKEYNARTQDKAGFVIPVEISVFEDRSFTFITKTPPASVLITKAAGIEKGSGESAKGSVGNINKAQLEEIAKTKLPDSEVAGNANVLIFPDLNTGNNTYKAIQRETGALAIGPMLQGLNKPVNDLSRGCTVDDIFNTVIISAIQSQNQ